MPSSVEEKRQLIEPEQEQISIRRQCELVGLGRASYYYEAARESELNLTLMRLIDAQYMATPFYGYPRMTQVLRRAGYAVNRKRVARLMGLMGIEAIYPRPRTTLAAPGHKVYPYLLGHLPITHNNHVWSSDITYIPLPIGFMYLVAVMDWHSRFVLSWQLSNTLEMHFCLDALQLAFAFGQPEIFNSDQGSQFTAVAFTTPLLQRNVRISMDGRGRALDNIFIERLWRSLKYEDIYIKEYQSVAALQAGLKHYFHLYNYERPHQSLAYATPAEVYFGTH
ncbi:MAG TPA: IS3 family transposase [Anaerolineae bacterium]|nr:IS3 family transposase [Anaerolineae bacterium]